MANAAALRLLPVPSNEPPYDRKAAASDDRDAPPGVRQSRSSPQAPLPLGFAPEPMSGPRPSPAARRTVSARSQRGIAEDLAELKQWRRTCRADLCHPQPWAVRLARGIAEVIAGARSPRQLSAWFTADALDGLVKVAKQQRIRDTVAFRVRPTGSAGRPGGASRGAVPRVMPDRRTRVLVRSVRTTEPSDGACEITVHLRIGERSRAVAMRAEGRDGRWMCTALQIG